MNDTRAIPVPRGAIWWGLMSGAAIAGILIPIVSRSYNVQEFAWYAGTLFYPLAAFYGSRMLGYYRCVRLLGGFALVGLEESR